MGVADQNIGHAHAHLLVMNIIIITGECANYYSLKVGVADILIARGADLNFALYENSCIAVVELAVSCSPRVKLYLFSLEAVVCAS